MKTLQCLVLVGVIYGQVLAFSSFRHSDNGKRSSRTRNEAKAVSFDELVMKFANKKAAAADTSVAWWDAHAQHPMVEDLPEHQISVSTSPFNYLVTTKVEEYDTVTATTTHTNHDDEQTSVRVTQMASYRSSAKWTLNKTLSLDAYLFAEAELPPALGGSVSITRVSLNMGQTNINSNNNRHEQFDVQIPPKSVVDVDWVATDRYLDSDWEVTVDIGGFVAVYFDDPVEGRNLNFYPVRELADDNFRATADGLAFDIKGVFEGHRTINFYPHPQEAKPLEDIEPGKD